MTTNHCLNEVMMVLSTWLPSGEPRAEGERGREGPEVVGYEANVPQYPMQSVLD